MRIEFAWLGGEPLTNGEVRTLESGNRYQFLRAPNGVWRASFLTTSVEVRLGAHGGTVTLTQLEDGSYLRGAAPFRSGEMVTGSNGHQYTLTLGDGTTARGPVQRQDHGSAHRPAGLCRARRMVLREPRKVIHPGHFDPMDAPCDRTFAYLEAIVHDLAGRVSPPRFVQKGLPPRVPLRGANR